MRSRDSSNIRSLLLLRLFIVGTCAPILWIGAGFAVTRSWSSPSGWGTLGSIAANVLWAVSCITFPTRALFLDTERLPEVLFMLLIASPLNGAYYALLGLIFWKARELLRQLIRRSKAA